MSLFLFQLLFNQPTLLKLLSVRPVSKSNLKIVVAELTDVSCAEPTALKHQFINICWIECSKSSYITVQNILKKKTILCM